MHTTQCIRPTDAILADNFRPGNVLELMKPAPRDRSGSSEMVGGRARSASQTATLTDARERASEGRTPKVGGADMLNTDTVLTLLGTAPRSRSNSSEMFPGYGILEDFTARATEVNQQAVEQQGPRTRSTSVPAPGMPGEMGP